MTTEGRGRRGPYAKTEGRRAEIAAACLALVIERGHPEVTVPDVADRAGVTEATVTYHFPTKDHLFIAALEQADVDDLPNEDVGSLADVSGYLESVIHAPASHPNRLRLFSLEMGNATDPDHPAHAWFVERSRTVREAFADMLQLLQRRGEAHPDVDPQRFARQLTATWDGLQIQWLSDPDFTLATEVIETFHALARTDLMAARRAIAKLAAEL